MKILLIMRHAKSDYPADVAHDIDRPLNKRGRKDVPRMAAVLHSFAQIPERILSSPAQRARETAEGVAGDAELLFDERLYMAGPETLAEVVAALPADCDSAMVVAHNPGLEDWIGHLCGARLRLPTAGLAALHLDVPRWDQIHGASAELQWFVTPRLVRAMG